MPPLAFIGAERYILSREFFGMKLGIDNISAFLHDIGSPHHAFKSVHVSGTNGKGSTSAMIASILHAAGYKTGLFTSPHLVTFRERIRVNGKYIPKRSVITFIEKHKKGMTRRKLTFFEVMTALAFDYFCRTHVDIAVIEVGLGGRLDATNVLKPKLTVTTDISWDHMEQLGNTLALIAAEKAGIVKSNTPHLIGILPEETLTVFEHRCRETGAPLVRLSPSDFDRDQPPGILSYHADGIDLRKAPLALYGTHQTVNSALAVKAITLLRQNGLTIGINAVKKGLKETTWPARFQVLSRRNRPTIVCDVGHNAGGVQAFAESFKKKFPGRKGYVIVGFVSKKEHQRMFDSLAPIAEEYWLVRLKTRRSALPEELLSTMDWHGVRARKVSSLGMALRGLTKRLTKDDIIVVIGSHYLAGEFLEKFGS